MQYSRVDQITLLSSAEDKGLSLFGFSPPHPTTCTTTQKQTEIKVKMVVKGLFKVELVDATNKAAFKEHTSASRVNRKTYVEVRTYQFKVSFDLGSFHCPSN